MKPIDALVAQLDRLGCRGQRTMFDVVPGHDHVSVWVSCRSDAAPPCQVNPLQLRHLLAFLPNDAALNLAEGSVWEVITMLERDGFDATATELERLGLTRVYLDLSGEATAAGVVQAIGQAGLAVLPKGTPATITLGGMVFEVELGPLGIPEPWTG
jgi:hypothetical protein